MSDVNPVCQAIVKSILHQWTADIPVAIQMGCRGGKSAIIKQIASDVDVLDTLLVTPNVTDARKLFENVAFASIINHSDFETMYCDDAGDAFDTIILEEPWIWMPNKGVRSEKLFHYARRLGQNVLAIGTWCQTNVWSFDAVIPKYASWETNLEFDRSRLENDQAFGFDGLPSKIHYMDQLHYGRNLLVDGEPHAV